LPQNLGTTQVDVLDEVSRLVGIGMHQYANNALWRTGYGYLGGAEQRHITEANVTGSSRWETAHQVGCGSEDHADQVLGTESVAIQHLLKQLHGRFDHFGMVIGTQLGRASDCSHHSPPFALPLA